MTNFSPRILCLAILAFTLTSIFAERSATAQTGNWEYRPDLGGYLDWDTGLVCGDHNMNVMSPNFAPGWDYVNNRYVYLFVTVSASEQLRSPIDGKVQQLSIHTVGGVVTAAQPLMVIVPRDRELLVEATVSNSDVGFVHVGQEVEVKVETFTFTRYGLLQGRIIDLSPDTVTRGDPKRGTTSGAGDRDERQTSSSPAYVAKIRLDQSSMMIDGQEQALGPGMAVTAEIKTGQRTIIGYLLSPLVAYTSESLRER
jgi:hypothetical protein